MILSKKGLNSAGLPTIMIERSKLEGTGILQASVLTGLALSNGEGRRHIKAGALKINGDKSYGSRIQIITK